MFARCFLTLLLLLHIDLQLFFLSLCLSSLFFLLLSFSCFPNTIYLLSRNGITSAPCQNVQISSLVFFLSCYSSLKALLLLLWKLNVVYRMCVVRIICTAALVICSFKLNMSYTGWIYYLIYIHFYVHGMRFRCILSSVCQLGWLFSKTELLRRSSIASEIDHIVL